MPGLAVRRDRRDPHGAVLVGLVVRLDQAGGALHDRVRVRLVDVRHFERDVDDAVAVDGVVRGRLGAGVHGADQHEAGRAGGQDVLGVVAVALLGAAVGDDVHAEAGRVVVRGLLRVADVEPHVVEALERERVGRDVVRDGADQLVEVDAVVGDRGAIHGLSHRWLLVIASPRAGRSAQSMSGRQNAGQLFRDLMVRLRS